MKILSKFILVAAAAFASVSAQALDLKFAGMGSSSPVSVKISLNGGEFKTTKAGILTMTDGVKNFNSYCADVFSPMNTSFHTYFPESVDLEASSKLAMAGRIAANSFFDADTPAEQAGLQLAIWSALHNGGSSFNADGDVFKVTGVNRDVLGFAESFFGRASLTPLTSVTYFGSAEAGAQSQIMANPVPEPFTLGIVAALGAAALIRRRRRGF